MSIVDVGNWAVFIIYTLVCYKSIVLFKDAHKACLHGLAQTIVYAFAFTLTLQSSMFMILQIEWILEDNNSNVSDVASWGWMFYDYFNGFALLCFVIAMDIYVNWHLADSKHDRRREDRM